mgnify:CR=1 FL=1
MKKLSKIKLQDAVVLENREMKTIFGGSGGACDPYAINWGGTCRTINGQGFCIRNSGTLLYCVCVIA